MSEALITFYMVKKLLKTIPYVWEANCFLLQTKMLILFASHITHVQPLSQTFMLLCFVDRAFWYGPCK